MESFAYELGQEIGLKTGDKIEEVNGHTYEKFSDLFSPDVLLSDNGHYSVERNGQDVDVPIPRGFLDKFSEKEAVDRFIDIRRPFVVGEIQAGSNAEKGGMKVGDRILSINGNPVKYYDEFEAVKQANKGKQVTLEVAQVSDDIEASVSTSRTLKVAVADDGKLGFRPDWRFEIAQTDYSLAEALPKGAEAAFDVVWINIRALGKIFSGDVSASKSLSGPIGIAQIFGGKWDWIRFWRITGLLSMVLAFMNFLPIPALDGGHVAFLTYEIVSGRKPSDKFLEGAQKVGMVLLLSLMVFAIFNDIFKVLF